MKQIKQHTTILFILILLVCSVDCYAQTYSNEKLKKIIVSMRNASETDVALQLIKMDLVDYYPAEITAALKKSYPGIPQDKTIRIYSFVRENMISKGTDFERVYNISNKLLKYMWLEERVKLFYFNSEIPIAGFTYPFALIFSSAAENILTDEEIRALLAHEIAHLIIQDIYKEAVKKNDLRTRRIVELFCDAAAISILEAKGNDSGDLISGLEKMHELATKVTGEKETGMEHPTIKQRKVLFNELKEKFDAALSKAIR